MGSLIELKKKLEKYVYNKYSHLKVNIIETRSETALASKGVYR